MTRDIAVNLGILAIVMVTAYGQPVWSPRRILIATGIVAAVGYFYLPDAPNLGRDGRFDGLSVAAGILLGLVAAAFVHAQHDDRGRVLTRAGIGYVAIWTTVVAAPSFLSWGSDSFWASRIRNYSMTPQIPGASTYRMALVLIALAMLFTRVAVTALEVNLVTRRQTGVRRGSLRRPTILGNPNDSRCQSRRALNLGARHNRQPFRPSAESLAAATLIRPNGAKNVAAR